MRLAVFLTLAALVNAFAFVPRAKRASESGCSDANIQKIIGDSFGQDSKSTAIKLAERLADYGSRSKKHYLSFCAPNEDGNELLPDPAKLCTHANRMIVCHVFETV